MDLYNKTDVELWNLFLEGERTALEILYKKHYDLLLNYGLKYCPDKELVKDCIQDLFVNLLRSTNYKPKLNPQSYLLKSLKNVIYTKLAIKKNFVLLEESCAFNLPENNILFKKIFSKNDEEMQLIKKLIEAYSKLPENQKSAIYLRYVRDLSYKEIAGIMDVNIQSSMNLVSRALAKLRTLIKIGFLVFFLFFLS